MKRALQTLLNKHTSSGPHDIRQMSKESLDIIIETSNGDIRSAVMALQFACTTTSAKEPSSISKSKAKAGSLNARGLLEVISRREQNLALFHLLGKILYNKRQSFTTCNGVKY